MAKTQTPGSSSRIDKPRTKRPGVQAECKTSRLKSAKDCVKA